MFNSTTPDQGNGARTSAASARFEGPPLGTIAKLQSTPLGSQAAKASDRRLLRFALQSSARELLPRERVSKCLRAPIPTAASIDVYRSLEFATAHYGGFKCVRLFGVVQSARPRLQNAGGSSWLVGLCSGGR